MVVKRQYAANAYPGRVHFRTELPRTPSGKLQREALRQRVAQTRTGREHVHPRISADGCVVFQLPGVKYCLGGIAHRVEQLFVRVPTYFSICGSLRSRSYTAMVLAEFAIQMDSRGGHLDQWESVATLPAFNPDLDPMEAAGGLLPDAVEELRERAANAAGLVVASPEYARGYPGALKNSLDWLVGSQAVFGRPAAVITASPGFKGGARAAEGLAEVLRTMSATPLHVLSVDRVTLKTTDGQVSDPETVAEIGSLVDKLLAPGREH